MANTVIRIKKSGVSGNVPGSLALGELALNYTDGLLYFANSTGITSFSANALSNTGNLITTTGSAQLLFPNKVTVSYTGFAGSQNASFVTSGSNTKGGVGYVDFLQANNLSAGANNTNKWFRLDSNGQFQIINSAYTTNIFNLNDSGVLTVPSFQNITLLPGGGGAITFADGTTQYSANASSGGGTTDAVARTQANAAFTQANSAASFANGAFTTANSAASFANGAFTQANSSYNVANSALANTGTTITVNGVSQLVISNTANSHSNTTGAVTISGGLGVAGNVYANGIYTSGLFYAANGNPISTGGGGTSLAYTAATTPPASGNNKGDQWYNTTTNVMYEWATDGTNYFWIDTSSPTVSNTANVNIVTTGNVNTNVVFANSVYIGTQNVSSYIQSYIQQNTINPLMLVGL